ncbi:proline--tRNA ligase (plasmid) [Streptomyces sp. BI20]|uniref:proline--tRNA ligase n=1 Tax=Streptomyces sp. BI20 TaxID=3403460 RepID=UPI003C720125
MRWSHLYVPTLREDPADAEAVSHRLLLRAGFVRQLMAGHYSLLPLAVRVRAKVTEVIREEMTAIGGQEIALPSLHPAELWQRSGRWETMGEEMFRLRDRKGADLALGMTHEEIVTDLARELASYRTLPQTWFQIHTKFRDEARPKSGLLRVREFTMKDAYSFDVDQAGLDRVFEAHREAYGRIFARLGLPAIGVEASSGSMGGGSSVEFMSPAEAGEDLVIRCLGCGYAANQEKAVSALPAVTDHVGGAAPEPFDTPDVRTIEELARLHGVPADRQVKTLALVVDDRPRLVLLRGDHTLMEQKLLDALGAHHVRPATAEEIVVLLGASPGSLGAVGVADVPVIADEALKGRVGMTTGANRDGVHLRHVDLSRDVVVERWADLREVGAGEACARCDGELEVVRTIEVGHVFKLGRKYTEALGVSVLGPDGKPVVPLMGCYGIGVERAMAAVVEAHHDERGIVWPAAIAPFTVAVVALSAKDPAVVEAAEALYRRLRDAGVDVVLDDRDERPGVKFRDVELVGIPLRVTVGARGLAEGVVEVTTRTNPTTERVPLAEAPDRVREVLSVTL